jgi:hypothetical protein
MAIYPLAMSDKMCDFLPQRTILAFIVLFQRAAN